MKKFLCKRKKGTIVLSICIMLFSLINTPLTVYGANNTQAITIRMEKIVGNGTSVTNMAGKRVSARGNMKLYSGYKVATARKNYVYMSLDSKKAVKEDQNSKIQIKKQGSKNEIYVLSGKLFFNVSTKLKSNESMNVKTSNMSMGIRGTSGVVSVIPIFSEKAVIKGMKYVIQIFDGNGYVEYEDNGSHNTTIKGGYQLVITQEENETQDIRKEKITLDDVPYFVLEELLKDEDLLNRIVKETDFTKEEIKEAFEKNREKEENEAKSFEDSLEQIKDKILKNETIIYGDEEANSPSPPPASENTSSPANSNLNADNLAGGNLTQSDLEQAFLKDSTVRLTTSESQKVIQINGALTVPFGKNLIIDEKITLKNPVDNVLENNGTLTNYGIHSIHNSGIIENNGEIDNKGTIYNEENSSLRSTGVIRNTGQIENKGQLELENGTLINSGIVANKDGSALFVDSKVKYENTGSLRIFSGVDTAGNIGTYWEKWRTVRFMDTDETTVLKEAYAPIGQIPEAPLEVQGREDFTGWSGRYDGVENAQVNATAGKQLQLEYMGMKIGCESFKDIDSLVDIDSSVNVQLMKDYNLAETSSDDKKVYFSENNIVIIDLNGFTLSTTGNSTIYNNGNLTIKNSKNTGGISAVLSPEPETMPTPTEPTVSPSPDYYTGEIIVNKGESLVIDNVNIDVESKADSSYTPFLDCNVINNQGVLLSMSGCRLVLNGTENITGIRNNTGKIELADTIIEVNISYIIVFELGEASPEGALKASNCRLIGNKDGIIGIRGIGNKNIVVNWENVMEFEFNSTCQKFAWEEI